jgi:adenylate cyclase
MRRLPWLTLGRLFLLPTLAVTLPAIATFYGAYESSRRSIVRRSEDQRERAAARIDEQLATDLGAAAMALEDVERAIRYAGLDPDDPAAVESRLFSELLDHPTLSDLSMTHAVLVGRESNGEARVARERRWQVSAFRVSAEPASAIGTARTFVRTPERGPAFVTVTSHYEPLAPLSSGAVVRTAEASDPTEHPTFATTVEAANYGRAIWSDLSYSEIDAALPRLERRVVVTVQKAVEAGPGHFAGVVRVGLLTRTIDSLPRLRSSDAERVILCDSKGRLVARLAPEDDLAVMGDDLRVVPRHAPPEIEAALANPGHSGPLNVGGTAYLVTFRSLARSQGWWVGVVAPEAAYTGDLLALRDRFLLALAAVLAVVLAGGGWLLGRVRGSLAGVLDVTARMRRFDFAPAPVAAPLRELAQVADGLERAKTSVRALGKYVSVDLVRELYDANREPELGGEPVTLSLLFSDIEGFTTLSERLAPDELARALGRYLEAMTRGVRTAGGTVDKFIGDAVMAFWNAPTRCDDHAQRACRAVLACRSATADLYASPAWGALPPLFTRFGVHTAPVLVGHFGAPDRISYTALGDGVNLAARLEGLCKQYGLAVLVSEATVQAGGASFAFRLVDRVAVKGKRESIRVYELLGMTGGCDAAMLATAAAYERALEGYFAGDFARALEGFAALKEDPPSRVMAERCRAMIAQPPGERTGKPWDGVYVATSK